MNAMQIKLKLITKYHPRGWILTLELPNGTTAGALMEHLLAREDFEAYRHDIFAGLVVLRNGLVVPRATVLCDGDDITIKKLMSGG